MNERGMIYPLILTLCFIVLIFFSYLTEKVASERHFVYMQEEQLRQVRLIQQGVDRAIVLADNLTVYPSERIYNVYEGQLKMMVTQTSVDEVMFMIEAVTTRQSTKRVKVYYNITQKSVTKWVEG
ncbi:competence type IV pilus minor pilin ComGG [Fictibacillus nanhaiensis]|uniref:competence type IV pilus minor pilin ComGG n=1 Tax=Fictibacillus nanhaiensis TaxID=742169 RepID=UPI002E251D02|nr:competence type IV pilus minor pilin ComGG [Fictibacillus nanhaiensis]